MPLMTWTDAFSVTLPEIDAEHKRLVGMINELHAAMKEGTAFEAIDGIFDGLVDYTIRHFGHEEQLMTEFSYPQYVVHKKQHTDLTTHVGELKKRLAQGGRRPSVTLETMAFLKEWLTTHIMDSDKRMGVYIAARRGAGA